MRFAATSAVVVGALVHVVTAHGPRTAAEVQAFYERQAAAYHCIPAVAEYTTQRKRSWTQRLLGGGPAAYQNVFSNDYFNEMSIGSSKSDEEDEPERQIMSCSAAEESKIRNSTCVLAPESTEGPYFHQEGHPIRSNMAEWQPGLLFLMNVGVIDIETCEPAPNVLVDLWHANATGHYAGHPEPAPDKVNEQPASSGPRRGLLSAYPRTNFHETWLRGALPTDKNGVAEFTSIFPGYYTGRATHVHAKLFPKWELQPNGTFRSDHLIHTGQLFFEDEINMYVDKLWPYNTNPLASMPGRGRTRNWDDSLQIYHQAHSDGYFPMFDIEPLGGVLTQGLIGYITMGVNLSASYEPLWRPTAGGGAVAKT